MNSVQRSLRRFVSLHANMRSVWGRNGNTSSVQNASRSIVRAAHPSWTVQQVEASAMEAFEAAALSVLLETIAYIKKIRPAIKVAMYGYPTRYYYHG